MGSVELYQAIGHISPLSFALLFSLLVIFTSPLLSSDRIYDSKSCLAFPAFDNFQKTPSVYPWLYIHRPIIYKKKTFLFFFSAFPRREIYIFPSNDHRHSLFFKRKRKRACKYNDFSFPVHEYKINILCSLYGKMTQKGWPYFTFSR